MSDVTRQVGGALGVAVIGSIIGSAYSGDMAGTPGLASESIGAAHGEAAALGGVPGQELAAMAGRAFTDALGLGLTAAAAVALARGAGRGAAAACVDGPGGGAGMRLCDFGEKIP